jgi:outer membrane protein assembly factor BamA
VHFDVQPGAVYYFGDITVSGASEDVVPLIKKTVSIRQGKQYSPKLMEDSQKHLRVLGLFRQIRFDLEDAAPDTLDVMIDIGMREPRSFETSARYWTDDGFSANARWTHRNPFKAGRGLSVIVFGSVLRQLARVSVWWPGILWARSRGVASVGSERQNEESYESVSTGVEFSLRHEYSQETTFRGAVTLTNEQVTNKTLDPDAFEGDEGRLFALNFAWDRFGGNDPIVATQGTVTRGFVEWAPEGQISQNHYILGETVGILYIPLPPRSGLATRLTVGAGKPTGTPRSEGKPSSKRQSSIASRCRGVFGGRCLSMRARCGRR